MARPYTVPAGALSLVGDPSTISGTGNGCDECVEAFPAVWIEAGDARRGGLVFDRTFSPYLVDDGHWLTRLSLYPLLYP